MKVPKVSDNFSCSQQVTENDVLDVIKKLNPGKSPGLDGFSPNFYLKFGLFLADLLARTLNKTFQRSILTYSMAQAIIVLFFKKGFEFDLANYRPISLMNFDYKILAYIITQKIELTFPNCIHPDQTVYLKGKFIGTNIQKVQDTMSYLKDYPQTDSVILFLDFHKAFDTVSHTFLLTLMEKMGYPKYIIDWIKIVYDKSYAMV